MSSIAPESQIRLISYMAKGNNAEFWFANASVDTVAGIFLRYFWSIGFKLKNGSASDSTYTSGPSGTWSRELWYRVKIKEENGAVHATVDGQSVRKKELVPLIIGAPVFPNSNPAPFHQLPPPPPVPGMPPPPPIAPYPGAVPMTTTQLRNLFVFLNDPANLQTAPAPGVLPPPPGLLPAGWPTQKSHGMSWGAIVAIGAIAFMTVFVLLLFHDGTFKGSSSKDTSNTTAVASVVNLHLDACRSQTKGYITGLYNCTGTVTVDIPTPITTDTVSVSLDFPDSGSFFHGSQTIPSGFTGQVTVPIVNDYEPGCVTPGDYQRTITVYDGYAAPGSSAASVIATADMTLHWTCSS